MGRKMAHNELKADTDECGGICQRWNKKRNDWNQQNISDIMGITLQQIERHCANITTILTVTLFVRCIQLTTPLPFVDANTDTEEKTVNRTGQRKEIG